MPDFLIENKFFDLGHVQGAQRAPTPAFPLHTIGNDMCTVPFHAAQTTHGLIWTPHGNAPITAGMRGQTCFNLPLRSFG